ncbi:MAG: LysR family transcriptional regulator [Labilithrix sp.]|nr:LysR family transcriptional regulator [Labilithrix sp.]
MTTKSDRLALMETFIRIVEAGSLSAAAAQLGTSQPTISRRLRALEGSLGVPLLLRTTHAIQLTGAGERYVARARELLADWRGFEAALRRDDDVPEGTLRVVAPHAFGQQQLVAPVTEYLRRYPAMTIDWRLHDGPVRLVEDGIDCMIRVGALEGESLVARKIYEVKRIVVAAPTVVGTRSITRPAQLAALPWLAIGTFYRNRLRLESERGAASIRIGPRFVTDSLFALRNATLAGAGVAVISEWLVRDDLAAGRLVHVLPRWEAPSLPVYIAYPQARFYPAKLRRFVEIMRTAFSAS